MIHVADAYPRDIHVSSIPLQIYMKAAYSNYKACAHYSRKGGARRYSRKKGEIIKLVSFSLSMGPHAN